MTLWASWVLWISWPKYYELFHWLPELSVILLLSRRESFHMGKRKKAGVGSGEQMRRPSASVKILWEMTGEETQFDAWMQHLRWQIWHSWIPKSHHNILDRRKLSMLDLPRLPWMKIKVKSLILIFPESSFTSTHYSALMTTVRLQIVECKDGLISILCPGNLFT